MKFEITHDITLDHPIERVFPVLALAPDLERLLALSEMLQRSRIVETRPGPTASSEVIVFEFVERVPLFGGLRHTDIPMRCEQTVDHQARRVDYRSRSQRGVTIAVHKERTFETVGSGTRVTEAIHGQAPPGIHLIARRSASEQHLLHMARYPELFA